MALKVEKKERTDNPLTDHSDDAEDSVDIVKAPSKEGEPTEDKVLSTEPPEKDDDEGEDGGELTPRQQKRRDRYDQMQKRLEEAERRAMESEHRAAAALAHVQVAMQQQSQKATDPLDEEEKQVDADWKRHLELADALSKGSTPEQQNEWKAEYLRLQKRMQQVVVKRELRNAPQQNMAEEMLRAHVQAHHPDFIGNTEALMYADGAMRQRLVRMRRQAPTLADYDEVFKQTRRELRMPGAVSEPPSEATRRKFAGTGLGGASHTNTRQGGGEVRMNEDMQRMAEAMYTRERDPKTGRWRALKPEEAHARWARGPGRKLMEKLQ